MWILSEHNPDQMDVLQQQIGTVAQVILYLLERCWHRGSDLWYTCCKIWLLLDAGVPFGHPTERLSHGCDGEEEFLQADLAAGWGGLALTKQMQC